MDKMDKKTFLAELEKNLAVLQEDELRDMINEYEQHIDMKIQSGLSEEEAIADFGNLEELTAEILEAYHVRTDYASGGRTAQTETAGAKDPTAGGAAAQLREGSRRLREGCARVGRAFWKGVAAAALGIRSFLVWMLRQLCRPFLWARRVWEQSRRQQGQENGADKEEKAASGLQRTDGDGCRTGGLTGIGRKLYRGLGACVRWCLGAAVWCIRAAWNLCCAGCSLLAVLCGLVCLFILGMLVVLLIDGYPLTGITLGCLGMTLCTFSMAGLWMTLLLRGKKKGSGQNA